LIAFYTDLLKMSPIPVDAEAEPHPPPLAAGEEVVSEEMITSYSISSDIHL
jgi:hypothetical protein